MNKRAVILIGVFVLLLAAVGGYLIVCSRNKSAVTKETVAGDLEYHDASGFSFKYPKSLKVEDITPSDSAYYSQLSLTKSGSKLTVTVKDESAKSVDELMKSNDNYKNAVLSGAITLAGISAKQYTLDGKLVTIALKDGILYLLEGDKDGGFWEDTQGVVASSFNFGQKDSGETTSSDSNTTYEPEEVVE